MADVATYADYEGAVRDTAAYLGVDPDWVVLTNGLDEGLLLAAIAYLMPRAPEALVALGAPPMAISGQPEQILMLPDLRAVRDQRQGARRAHRRRSRAAPTSSSRWTRCWRR